MGSTTEVWAQLWVCGDDCLRIRELLLSEGLVKPSSIIPKMHLTVYHARRPMLGVSAVDEEARVVVPTAETRFMVLAPGGENPRPELEPKHCKVGIRIQRKNVARSEIQVFRERLLAYETPNVLGGRRPSTGERNAFGARHFQPHIALIQPGNRMDRDLTRTGELFRQAVKQVTLDRFSIEIVRKDNTGKRVLLR
jgi:hypothetical protein